MRPEGKTQKRVITLFTDPSAPNHLGYDNLGDWRTRSYSSFETHIKGLYQAWFIY